ncbi:MAG: serine/threonine protein kinase [Prevotellaceae bacterium]|nr:serine/threonine protein kinase [Prevotellaceae bacterium]
MNDIHLKEGVLLQGGKYRVVRFISSGGFGCTYEALHTMFNLRVALKEFFISDFCNRNQQTGEISLATQSRAELVGKLKKKFVEEARSVFQMQHPNIVRVIDVFEENGTAYYAMDFIDGHSLHEEVKQRGSLPESEAVGYVRQVADALRYVHSLNRLHLDIKPGNIMLDRKGNAVLIDFGASKHYDEESGENTSTLLGVNTKGYAPVEQQKSSFTTFNPAADIYALGATLYKLLTGVTPPDAVSLLSEEETLPPLPTTVSPQVRSAVYAAMRLKRKDRPQSIDEFLALLDGTPRRIEDGTTMDDGIPMGEVVDSAPETEHDRGGFKMWRDRNWFTNVSLIVMALWSLWLWLIVEGRIFWDEYLLIFEIFGPILCFVGVLRILRNRREGYLPLLLGLLVMVGYDIVDGVIYGIGRYVVGVIYSLCYELSFYLLLLTLFIRKNGVSAFRLLKEAKRKERQPYFVWKSRHWAVNAITCLTSVTALLYVGIPVWSSSHYSLLPLSLMCCYSLYLVFRNDRSALVLLPLWAIWGIWIFGNSWDRWSWLLSAEEKVVLWGFIVVPVLCIVELAALFIRKGGRSAISLME